MFSFKALSLAAVCMSLAVVSAKADLITTWTLENIVYADGTTITGTFDYNATNQTYSNVDFTVNATVPSFSGTTFGVNPLYDVVYTDPTGLQIANAPSNTPDFRNVTTNNCADPSCQAVVPDPCPPDPNAFCPNGHPAFGTSLFALGFPDLPAYDPGTFLPLNLMDAGFCVDGVCDNYVNPAVGPQAGSNPGFFATLGPQPPPGSTPEPSTFLLGGSVLAIGLVRRKFLKRS